MSSKKRSTRTTTRTRAPKVKGEIFNVHHPDNVNLVEVAFKVKGKTYYRYTDDFRMPVGRYKYVYAFHKEVEMRMSLGTLKAYVDELKRCISGEKKVVDLEGVWRVIFNMETRVNLAFEPDTVRRLASVVYFDATEDLSTFDMKYGEKKVEFWKKNNVTDFFLTRPISELLGLEGISITSLEEYLRTSTSIIEELTSELPHQLSENS